VYPGEEAFSNATANLWREQNPSRSLKVPAPAVFLSRSPPPYVVEQPAGTVQVLLRRQHLAELVPALATGIGVDESEEPLLAPEQSGRILERAQERQRVAHLDRPQGQAKVPALGGGDNAQSWLRKSRKMFSPKKITLMQL